MLGCNFFKNRTLLFISISPLATRCKAHSRCLVIDICGVTNYPMNDTMFVIIHEFDAIGSMLMMGTSRLREAKSALVSAEAELEPSCLMPESLATCRTVLES